MMIGTGIQGFILIGGGGGGGSDTHSINITVTADGGSLQNSALVGATSIISIMSRENGIINEGIVFNSATGTITLDVFDTETYTITYKKTT